MIETMKEKGKESKEEINKNEKRIRKQIKRKEKLEQFKKEYLICRSIIDGDFCTLGK